MARHRGRDADADIGNSDIVRDFFFASVNTIVAVTDHGAVNYQFCFRSCMFDWRHLQRFARKGILIRAIVKGVIENAELFLRADRVCKMVRLWHILIYRWSF